MQNTDTTNGENNADAPALSIAKLAAALNLSPDATEDQVIARMVAQFPRPLPLTVKVTIENKDEELSLSQIGEHFSALMALQIPESAMLEASQRTKLVAQLCVQGNHPVDPETGNPYLPMDLLHMPLPQLQSIVAPGQVPIFPLLTDEEINGPGHDQSKGRNAFALAQAALDQRNQSSGQFR